MRTQPGLLAAFLVVLPAFSTFPGRCQEVSISDDELIPWALLVDDGEGVGEDIDVGGRAIQVVRIPISYPLRTREEHGRGLRVTIPISFGFHELTVDTVQEGKLRENLSTLTILPGLEWELGLPDRGVLKPFFEIGLGSDLGSSHSAWIYSLGSRFLRPIKEDSDDWLLGARLQFSGSWISEVARSETILTAEVGFERMIELGWTVRDQNANLGIYSLVHHNFTQISVKELDDSTTKLRRTALEIGVSLGTDGDIVVLGMRLPRIGLSYRSSGDFRSWRINFGFPF